MTEHTLPKDLRRKLEGVIVKARDIAESAARTELERLAVGEKTAATYLSDEQRKLRNRLRAHGRQLGDRRKPDGEQALDRLVTEVAYEHWHRMLFARFLAENDLLIYEDGVTPLSIHDCFELAEEETSDRTHGWQYAARYAGNMLPQIFRVDSPVFNLQLAPNDQKQLEQMLTSLEEETFTASDALGWVYQFWQSKRKDEVNASEVKIGADELPAVTQLFTEPYMVSFLLDNSLGAWWAARRLTKQDLATATSEEELRSKAAIPGVPLEYLRFVRHEDDAGDKSWTPAAGTFDAWPENLGELKTLDPCCGSGHFLVAAFLMLVPMRMEDEGLSAGEAVDAVLRENIHGLELDQRCVELAVFALALTAWKYPGAGGYRVLPELNMACSGLSVSVAKEEWKELGLGKKNLTIALDWMHDAFKDAPVLGSLLNPAKTDAAKVVQWDELSGALEQALKQEQTEDQQEVAVVAQGLAKAAILLAGQYHLVITNVPYLARGRQSKILREFCELRYSRSKQDLATVFLERCEQYCAEGGTVSIVLPENWLFLAFYAKFRKYLLEHKKWRLLARLGAGAFDTISGEVVKAVLLNIDNVDCQELGGSIFEVATQKHFINYLNVSSVRGSQAKAESMLQEPIRSVGQVAQLKNPDCRVILDQNHGLLVSSMASEVSLHEGMSRGDTFRFDRCFWELSKLGQAFSPFVNSPSSTTPYEGRELVIYWERGKGALSQSSGARITGYKAWGKLGVFVARTGSLKATLSNGDMHAQNGAVLLPNSKEDLPALWSFCESDEFNTAVRSLDSKIIVASGAFLATFFDKERWAAIAADRYPGGLPKPYSDKPNQWIFHGHPCGSLGWDDGSKWIDQGQLRSDGTVLQVSVARLLGYRWPAELDPSLELADEQREWVNQCDALLPFADEDGIACIPAVRGEQPAYQRIEALLQAAYGEEWSISIRDKLLESVGCKNKSLDFWLREKFFEQHCKLFQHRPFIWHIWDGLKDGFAALVNYHQLDRKNLERLIYTYLDDWIRTQKQDQSDGVEGAGVRLAAAQGLKRRLEQILEGEAPYDIFVRWKPLEQQAVGWDPDLNDGVRLNIRPFLSVEDVGKKGAGILRAKPNIHWRKDRGKDVPSAPWYSVGLEYGEGEGARINDHHLTLAAKKATADA